MEYRTSVVMDHSASTSAQALLSCLALVAVVFWRGSVQNSEPGGSIQYKQGTTAAGHSSEPPRPLGDLFEEPAINA